MTTILLAIHVIITLLLIGVILLQKSEGGGLGGSSNSSSSAFSARGAANALTHATAVLAGLFFVMCILLKWDSNRRVAQDDSVLAKVVAPSVAKETVSAGAKKAETIPVTQEEPKTEPAKK